MVGGIWKSILRAATARLNVTNSADGAPQRHELRRRQLG
jgi:hypothetical protein